MDDNVQNTLYAPMRRDGSGERAWFARGQGGRKWHITDIDPAPGLRPGNVVAWCGKVLRVGERSRHAHEREVCVMCKRLMMTPRKERTG